MKTILRLLGIKDDFGRLFYTNEYRTLAGENRQVILKLIAILFLTLFALGFAVGSIENLKSKMNNPYTNWVDFKVTNYVKSKIVDIQKDFKNPIQKDKFQLNDVRGSVRFFEYMYHQDYNPTIHPIDSLCYQTSGLTIDADDPLLNKILVKENLYWKDANLGVDDENSLANCEIIMTADMISRLGFDPENDDLGNIIFRKDEFPLPMKVVGVVKELPLFCGFVCSPQVYNILSAKKDEAFYCFDLLNKNESGNNRFKFIAEENLDKDKLALLLKEFYHLKEEPVITNDEIFDSGNKRWRICEIYFNLLESPDLEMIPDLLKFVVENGQGLSQVTLIECNDDLCAVIPPSDFYRLAFNFNRLDKIREFKTYMKIQHDVDIDMTQVESKENFAVVTKLTFLISIVLLAFGILSIILFVNSLLQSHLYKVRSNLGTFKAFGLDNKFLNGIYLKIIFSFLMVAILFSLGLAMIYDRIEQMINLTESKFDIFDSTVVLAMIVLVAISLLISSRTIKRILGDTPGNLIYER